MDDGLLNGVDPGIETWHMDFFLWVGGGDIGQEVMMMVTLWIISRYRYRLSVICATNK